MEAELHLDNKVKHQFSSFSLTAGLQPVWLVRLDTTKYSIKIMVKSAYEPSSPSVRSLSPISACSMKRQRVFLLLPGSDMSRIERQCDSYSL